MNAHTIEAYDLTTYEGQVAAAKARARRHAEAVQKLRMRSAASVPAPIGAEQAPAEVQRPPLALVPQPVMQPPVPLSAEAAAALAPETALSAEQKEAVRQFRDALPEKVRIFRQIELDVCVAYCVSRHDLWSSRRTNILCSARQEAYWRLRHESRRSYPEIGRACGGRDHTTILHGVRKMDCMLTGGHRMKTLPDVTGVDPLTGAYVRDGVAYAADLLAALSRDLV